MSPRRCCLEKDTCHQDIAALRKIRVTKTLLPRAKSLPRQYYSSTQGKSPTYPCSLRTCTPRSSLDRSIIRSLQRKISYGENLDLAIKGLNCTKKKKPGRPLSTTTGSTFFSFFFSSNRAIRRGHKLIRTSARVKALSEQPVPATIRCDKTTQPLEQKTTMAYPTGPQRAKQTETTESTLGTDHALYTKDQHHDIVVSLPGACFVHGVHEEALRTSVPPHKGARR